MLTTVKISSDPFQVVLRLDTERLSLNMLTISSHTNKIAKLETHPEIPVQLIFSIVIQ